MIRSGFRRDRTDDGSVDDAKGFDAFDLRLGDLMRGERATLGKSLLDVQRELKIKAAYIAAIENADPTAFDTPGFIAGYVRSYARYLGMDPDWAFETFCAESGFATAHGMSDAASTVKAREREVVRKQQSDERFLSATTPFTPRGEGLFSRIEPGAFGSVLVLVALIGGLGYGGWTVLQEVQRVQMAPVERTPTVVTDIDPLAGARAPGAGAVAGFDGPSPEALDRLYRPEALDVPVMVARDGPISTLDAARVGALVPEVDTGPIDPAPDLALADAAAARPDVPALDAPASGVPASGVQVTEDPMPGVQLVAVRPAWVRVRAADGTVIYEAIMNKGDVFDVPQTEDPATLRIGESGSVYFRVDGVHYGPVGPRGAVSSNVALDSDSLVGTYAAADLSADGDLAELVQVAELAPAGSEDAAPAE